MPVPAIIAASNAVSTNPLANEGTQNTAKPQSQTLSSSFQRQVNAANTSSGGKSANAPESNVRGTKPQAASEPARNTGSQNHQSQNSQNQNSQGQNSSPEKGSAPANPETVARELANKEMASREFLGKDIPNRELASKELLGKDIPNRELASKELSGKDIPNRELASKELSGKELTNSRQTKNGQNSQSSSQTQGRGAFELPSSSTAKSSGQVSTASSGASPSQSGQSPAQTAQANAPDVARTHATATQGGTTPANIRAELPSSPGLQISGNSAPANAEVTAQVPFVDISGVQSLARKRKEKQVESEDADATDYLEDHVEEADDSQLPLKTREYDPDMGEVPAIADEGQDGGLDAEEFARKAQELEEIGEDSDEFSTKALALSALEIGSLNWPEKGKDKEKDKG